MEEKQKDRVLLFLNNCTTLTPIVEIDDPENESHKVEETIVGFTESTILVGDGTYNGMYFPTEELEKAFHTWDKQPMNMNHSDDIKDEVGYITKPRYDTQTKQLKVTPILNKETFGYKAANGYIQNRMKAGKPPEVSIGVWVDREYEIMEDDTERLTARNLQGDHLALVSRGACSPEAGCGIGLSKESTLYIDLDDNIKAEYILHHIDYEQNTGVEKKQLIKEIKKQQIKKIKLEMEE